MVRDVHWLNILLKSSHLQLDFFYFLLLLFFTVDASCVYAHHFIDYM